jgi:hypothetical protein
MASPPTTIVPLPVVIAEGRILLTAERGTAEVVINSHIASAIIGEVPCPVEVPIHDYVVTRTKLIGISITINIEVSVPIDCEVSVAVNHYVVASTKFVGVAIAIHLNVPCPINRVVSVAIDGNVVSRAQLLVPRDVSLPKSLIPRDVSLANLVHPGVLIDGRV